MATINHLAAAFMSVLAQLNPQAPNTGYAKDVATNVAHVVSYSKKMPANMSPELMVAILAVFSWNESRNNPGAIGKANCDKAGDCGAYGLFQIEHHPEFLGNTDAQIRYEMDLIMRSSKACPDHPLALVTSGRCSVSAIADDRLMAAKSALTAAEVMGML